MLAPTPEQRPTAHQIVNMSLWDSEEFKSFLKRIDKEKA
jgi:hypothetical protein